MSKLLAYARAMRREPTPAERTLWRALRNAQVAGMKFRRQVPLWPFIADFCCAEATLVVEVDGNTHDDPRRDAARDAWFRTRGIDVLRVTNRDVAENPDGVLDLIAATADGLRIAR